MAVLKDLIVHGSSRFLNKSYFNTINAKSIGADQGIFKKLIATSLEAEEATIDNLTADNAIVTGLLDVQGELHTNAWTNANIANIGGSFYISPTVEPTDGTTTISITRNSATSWTISATGTFATDFIKSGTATSGVAWPANSLVLITGDVVVGNMVYPLGTLKGTLNAQVTATAASTSKTITITGVTDAQNNNAPSVLQELYSVNNNTNIANAPFKKGKISLYKLGSNPIGILMTSMGTNSNSLMDIYGGVSTTPSVRIGHLGALASYTDTAGNTRQPTGWGIYTDNGFFKGVIVADSGSIGHFTINSKAIYSGSHDTWNKSSTGIFLGTNDTNYYISGGSGASWWIRDDGRFQFGGNNGITYNGTTLSIPAANVSGELTAATISGTKITAGTIGTDQLAANAVTSAKIKAGEVKATNIASNAVTAEKLDATTINASNKLTVGAMTTTDQSNILNSNIQIGGRNLFKYSHPSFTYWWSSNSSGATVSGDKITIPNAGEFFQRYQNLYLNDDEIIPSGTELTLSCYFYENTIADGYHRIYYASQYINNGSRTTTWLYKTVPANFTGLWSETFTTTLDISGLYIEYDTRNKTSGQWVCGPCKLEIGNKATDWSPAPQDVDAHKYITDIDTQKGITIKPVSSSENNDYLQMDSTSIDFYRGIGTNNAAVSVMSLSDSTFRMGTAAGKHTTINTDGLNVYTGTESASTKVATFGSSISLASNEATVTIGSTSKYHAVLSSTAMEFKNGALTNKTLMSISGNKVILYKSDTTTAAATLDSNGLALSAGSITLGSNFSVNASGSLTAKSGTIGGWNISTNNLYIGAWGADNSAMLCTGTVSAKSIGGSSSINGWVFTAGSKFGVTKGGALYCSDIYANGGTIGGCSIVNGVLQVANANITGGITIGKLATSVQTSIANGDAAKDAIDNLEIGGRNYYKNYSGSISISSGATATKDISINGITGNNTATSGIKTLRLSKVITEQGYWTVSGYIKSDNSFTFTGDICDVSSSLSLLTTTEYKYFTFTVNITRTIDSTYHFVDLNIGANAGNFWIKDIKVEKGNKPTAWSPAPEDVDNQIIAQGVEYIVGTQTASTGSWTGVTKESELIAGKTIAYRLPYAGSGNASLNLTLSNGSTTGAKEVYSMTTRVTTHYPVNSIIQMTYDGTAWRTTGWYNTNTVGAYGGQVIAGTNSSNASATTIYRYTLVMKKTTGTSPTWVSVVTSNSTGTSKARYTGGLYPDKILYMGSGAEYATSNRSGDCYDSLALDFRYSSNCGSTLTAGKPVYLVGTINATDGLFYLDSTWWTQTEPTTEDGKLYIYLGIAYSASNVMLNAENPQMIYYENKFRKLSEAEEMKAAKTATNYITNIDANGIWVTPSGKKPSNISTGAGATGTRINGDGMQIFNAGTQIASYGSTVTIGQTAGKHTVLDSNGFRIKNNSTVIADFGSTITLGQTTAQAAVIDTNGMSIYKGGTKVADFGTDIVLGQSNANRIGITSSGVYFNVSMPDSGLQTIPFRIYNRDTERDIIRIDRYYGCVQSEIGTAKSLSAGQDTYTDMVSITLGTGSWIIYANGIFPTSSSSGASSTTIRLVDSSGDINNAVSRMWNGTSNYVRMPIMVMYRYDNTTGDPEADVTVVTVRMSSSLARTGCTAAIYAMKVA